MNRVRRRNPAHFFFGERGSVSWNCKPPRTGAKRRTSNIQRPTSNLELREKPIEDEDAGDDKTRRRKSKRKRKIKIGTGKDPEGGVA